MHAERAHSFSLSIACTVGEAAGASETATGAGGRAGEVLQGGTCIPMLYPNLLFALIFDAIKPRMNTRSNRYNKSLQMQVDDRRANATKDQIDKWAWQKKQYKKGEDREFAFGGRERCWQPLGLNVLSVSSAFSHRRVAQAPGERADLGS